MPEDRILFDSLSPRLRGRIKSYLRHREQFWGNIRSYSDAVPKSALAISFLMTGGLSAAIFADESAKVILAHNNSFRNELGGIYRSLAIEEKSNPELHSLLSSRPYISIDAEGNLLGRKFAPKLFRIPLGPRRIVSPFAAERKKLSWLKGLPRRIKRPSA